MSDYFKNINEINYEGPDSENPLSFKYYDENKQVLGKTMREHLRFATCYWHTFTWPSKCMPITSCETKVLPHRFS